MLDIKQELSYLDINNYFINIQDRQVPQNEQKYIIKNITMDSLDVDTRTYLT